MTSRTVGTRSGEGAAFGADFVARKSVRDLEVSCAAGSSAPPFVTR